MGKSRGTSAIHSSAGDSDQRARTLSSGQEVATVDRIHWRTSRLLSWSIAYSNGTSDKGRRLRTRHHIRSLSCGAFRRTTAAAAGLSGLVDLHMPCQVAGSCRGIVTAFYRAPVRALSSVLAHVGPEMTRLRSSVVASRLLARVRPFASVHAHVPAHVAAARRGIVAAFPRALVRPISGVHTGMLIEIAALGC